MTLYLLIYVAICAVGTIAFFLIRFRRRYRESGIIELDLGDIIFSPFWIVASPVVAPIWACVELQELFNHGFPPAVQGWLDTTVIRYGKRKILEDTPPDAKWYAVLGKCKKITEAHANQLLDAIPITCRGCILELEHKKPLAGGAAHSCGKEDDAA